MADSLEQRIIDVIQNALSDNPANEDIVITVNDSMETVAAWDSLSFMRIFVAVNEDFGINPDFDDAIHYTSVESLHTFLRKKIA